MEKLGLILVPALLCGGGVARADDAAPQNPPVESGLVEHVDVQLVQLNFLAVDRKGSPVLDLNPNEVEVLEDGKPQRIAFLQPYYSREARVSASDPSRPGSTTAPDGTVPAAAPIPGRWIVIVFDHYLASQGTKIKAVEAARHLVDSGIGPGDQVSIVSFDGKLNVIQNFTSDREKLRLACERALTYVQRASEDRYRALDSLVDAMENCKGSGSASVCAQRVSDAYENDRIRDLDAFATAIKLLIRSVAPIPETKALYLITEGFPRTPSSDAADAAEAVLGSDVSRYVHGRDRSESREQFDQMAEAAGNAKVSIFTINPGGSRKMGSISAAQGAFMDARGNPLQIDIYRRAEINAQQSLSELAQRTGGVATQGSDIAKELTRLNALSSALYTVGYYATEKTLATGARKVKIKVQRRGVRAEFQRNLPRSPARASLSGELALEPGLCSEAKRRPVTFKFRVDRSALTFNKAGGGKVSANFALYTRVLADGGLRSVYKNYRFFNITNTAEEHASGKMPDPAIEQVLVLPCDALTVAVTATDAESGAQREFTASLAP